MIIYFIIYSIVQYLIFQVENFSNKLSEIYKKIALVYIVNFC